MAKNTGKSQGNFVSLEKWEPLKKYYRSGTVNSEVIRLQGFASN